MKRGIVLIALGHENYFQMARTLAASIKYNEPEILICVVTEGNREIETKLFDKAVVADPAVYMNGGNTEYIKSKLFMYDLSPFKETIFLDVDQIVLEGRKLGEVFEELKDIDVSLSNTGVGTYSQWADISEVKQLYGDHPFWNFHSEFVYFKKCKEARRLFIAAKKTYSEGAIKSAYRFANASMADELAFQVAAMQTGIYPHKENWLPNFWHFRYKDRSSSYPYQLKTEFYTYSIGGAFVPPHVAANYNNLAAFYFNKMGLQNAYKARDKRSFLPERQKI